MQTKALPASENHYLRSATGWIELGNIDEALLELEHINPLNQFHPDVLMVRWILLAKAKKWERALAIARTVVKLASERPAGWIAVSFSLYQMQRTFEAWMQLVPASRKFPESSAISFYLACYACKLGNLREARNRLTRSMEIEGNDKIRSRILHYPDLAPLWDEIAPPEARVNPNHSRIAFKEVN